ncbi:hypothetical protein CYY_003248 [Polysphondylium violaceum]|uniref:Uncharacterized protein n=1 Tax=Polysphondylium violaceum TaxID=133409 RepID=A0A8J4V647_9MYCE|nr:hypothetical protein CYY_003248 [Polysphondylium violaceum]
MDTEGHQALTQDTTGTSGSVANQGKSTNGQWMQLDVMVRVKCSEPLIQGMMMIGWWDECVPDRLKQLHSDGYQVVIFGNHAVRTVHVQTIIDSLQQELGIPLMIFISTGYDLYRTPSKKMWDLMANEYATVQVNRSESFFVGDLAGRLATDKRRADLSSIDHVFAMAVGVRFETPDSFFLGEPLDIPSIDLIFPKPETCDPPVKASKQTTSLFFFIFKNISLRRKIYTIYPVKDCPEVVSEDFELVIFVGWPVSGKTRLAKKYFLPAGYAHISNISEPWCMQAAHEALSKKQSVVIDNTNANVATRAIYIAIAKQHGASVRCFNLKTEKSMAERLNYFRERKQGIRHTSMADFIMYEKSFQEPNVNEGFNKIHQVEFNLIISPEDRELFNVPIPNYAKRVLPVPNNELIAQAVE